jgi:Predicted membrane protein
MSKLRQTFLEQLRILGNQSGCHQLPERSFFINGKQFPVCARCTGVTIGQASAILYFLLTKKVSLKFALISLSIMGIDWGTQAIGLKSSTNLRRLLTGICGGFGIIMTYIYFLKKVIYLLKSVLK